jgi:hypothetical protein
LVPATWMQRHFWGVLAQRRAMRWRPSSMTMAVLALAGHLWVYGGFGEV